MNREKEVEKVGLRLIDTHTHTHTRAWLGLSSVREKLTATAASSLIMHGFI